MIAPPAVRSSAVVDPRIGDLGPALLALEDGTVFPGIAFGFILLSNLVLTLGVPVVERSARGQAPQPVAGS